MVELNDTTFLDLVNLMNLEIKVKVLLLVEFPRPIGYYSFEKSQGDSNP